MSAAPPAAGLPPAPAATPPVATAPEISPPTPVVAEPPVVAAPPVVAVPPVAAEPPVAVPPPVATPPADPPVVATPPVVSPPPAPVAPPPAPVAPPPAPVAPPPAVVNAPPPQAPPPPVVGVPPPVVDVSPPPPVTSPPPPAVTPDAPPPSVTPPTAGNAPPSPSESPPPPSLSEPPPPPSPAAPPPEETAAPPPPGTRAPPPPSVSSPPVVLSPPGASASPPPPPPLPLGGPTPSKTSIGLIGGIAAGGGLLALLALVLLFVFCRKRKNKKNVLPYAMAGGAGGGGAVAAGAAYKAGGMGDRKAYAAGGNARLPPGGGVPLPPEGSPSVGNSRTWFTYEELHAATNGFATANLLGEGGFGRVYKGELPDGQVVAVKQLTIGGGQGEREFRAEVEIISRVHHRHLVSLVGYCIVDKQRLLVYDFVPNGTLDVNLYGKGKPVMDWETRVRVALGAARGLAYLHEDCHPRIIHRDIKSSNILLDDKYEAQVADFGLAKLASDTHTHVSTRVMGTFGYLAPEYAQSGKLTEKSDVYSFGVVLLELITGRKPIDQSNQESLVEWGRPLMTYAMEDGDVDDLVDPRLDGNYDSKEMFRMIEVAASCVRHTASKRPKMGQVVRALESEEENAGLYTGLRPGMSSEHESDFDRYAGSDYDTQAFNADMLRSGTSSVFRGSSSELEPIFPKAAETRIDVRASGPMSVRTGRSSLPSIRGASGRTMDSYTSLPPTRAAPPRPGQASDSDNSDMFMPPPPPPPNFSDELYAPIDFNPGIRDGR